MPEQGSVETPNSLSEKVIVRGFQISPKSSHDWIVEHGTTSGSSEYRQKLTEDIISNGVEIEQGVSWHDVLSTVSWYERGIKYTGKSAISHSLAPVLGGVAREMGWNMHTPQMVYMSVYVFLGSLGLKLKGINENITAIMSGSSSFASEEVKQMRLKILNDEAGRFGVFMKRIRTSIEEYADGHLPDDENYRSVLQMLTRVGTRQVNKNSGRKAMTALKHGDTKTAYSILKSGPHRKYKRE